MFYTSDRLALLVDGASLYTAARALPVDIDFVRLLDEFGSRSRLVRAFYFTLIGQDGDSEPLRALLTFLDYNGYSVVTKQAREYVDAQGRHRIRGSLDIEVAVRAFDLVGHVDHIVLCSSDSTFRPLVSALQRRGVRVSVLSTVTNNSISDELRRQADHFIDLVDLVPAIGRDRDTRGRRPG